MRPIIFLAMLGFMLHVFTPSESSAASGEPNPLSRISGAAELSADDFDWRDMVPYLYIAAALPGEQGIKAVLENSKLLRAYVASDVQADCNSGRTPCGAGGSLTLQGEVSKRIDEIVQEGTSHRRHIISVDYPLTHQPFPFIGIAALRTDNHRDAYLVVDFADHACTAAQLREKYGDPYDTNVIAWYSVYRYRMDTKDYAAGATFKIDPVNGEVIAVAISVKRKDGHK
jgi:hypothetical protein